MGRYLIFIRKGGNVLLLLALSIVSAGASSQSAQPEPEPAPEAAEAKSGGLGRDVILRIIQESQGHIRHCYESELRNNPHLEGRIATEFVIGQEGRVIEFKFKENSMDGGEAVASCVERVVRAFRFPKPEGGGYVNVSYPWVFHTEGGRGTRAEQFTPLEIAVELPPFHSSKEN